MYKCNIVDIKNNLRFYLDQVLKGGSVTVMKRNVPIARIIPFTESETNKTKLGCGLGTASFYGDLTEPLIPDSDWEMHK